jgi:hypothetical protein
MPAVLSAISWHFLAVVPSDALWLERHPVRAALLHRGAVRAVGSAADDAIVFPASRKLGDTDPTADCLCSASTTASHAYLDACSEPNARTQAVLSPNPEYLVCNRHAGQQAP